MPEVTVTISPAGEVGIDVAGVRGKGCRDLTRALETALGALQHLETKPEYHQAPQAGQQAAQRKEARQ